jgi:serine/threonine-protein kinase
MYEAGTIIEQKPRAGKSIKQHQAILLTVVAEKPLTIVPDVRGLSVTEALKRLNKTELKCFLYPHRVSLPSHTCIVQSPSPNTKVEYNTPVVVYYAITENMSYLLPHFKDMPAEEAIELIEKYGHRVECIHYRTHETINKEIAKKGTIFAQKPLAGTLIDEQQKETIYLTIKI